MGAGFRAPAPAPRTVSHVIAAVCRRRSPARARAAAAIALGLLAVGCPEATPEPARRGAGAALEGMGTSLLARERAGPDPTAACQRRIDAALEVPSLSGAPRLEARRVELLLRAKSEPLLFVVTPLPGAHSEAAQSFRRRLIGSRYPWDVVQAMLPLLRADPPLAREVLLHQGYLFGDTPELAFALTEHVRADHLFDAPEIWVERGEQRLRARRDARGRYVWSAPPQAGRAVHLLNFDRVFVEEPGAPLHRDLRSLRRRLGFERLRVRHLRHETVVADLRYGEDWVPTLLTAQGARLELGCEAVPAASREAVAKARAETLRREALVDVLRDAMRAQIEEGLPFDEPLTEMGQQDGRLRPNWRFAYTRGRRGYRFDVDWYPVFDPDGRPLVPQVCTDLLLDTLERASGRWWRSQGQPPGLTEGKLAFDPIERAALRGAWHFLEWTQEMDAWFDVWVVPEAERFGIGRRDRLARFFAERADFRNGDMGFVYGWTPWDDHERHYHSFYVYETDPVSGAPIAIVGNAGRPSIRPWETEQIRTPRRELIRRIRPRTAWLGSFLSAPTTPEGPPPPLSWTAH